MTEIIFYCIDSDVNRFLFNFLNQLIFKNGKKVFLYSNSAEKLKNLDKMLWDLCEESEFLPHSVYNSKNESQKYERLLLSDELLNFNSANYLLISTFLDNFGFINGFEKLFYVYSRMSKNSVDQARISFDNYKNLNYKVSLNIRNGGKWESCGEFVKLD